MEDPAPAPPAQRRWRLLLIFKPHAMMMDKLIYFLPLSNIRTNKTQNTDNGADSGVVSTHHVKINYQLYKENKVILE